MPSRKDGRIEPGQPLKSAISAAAWNRAQDAADVVLGQRPGFGAEPSRSPPATYVAALAINNYSRTLEMYEPVHYVAPFQTNSISFQPPMRLQNPTDALPTMLPFVVTLEPIASGKYGRVAISGIVLCRVTGTATDSRRYLVLNPDNAPRATTNPTGWAKMLQFFPGSEDLFLIDLNQQSHTPVALYTPSWPAGLVTTTVTEYDHSFSVATRQFRARNYHVNLPVGPKRLVFNGPCHDQFNQPIYVLVAAQCESD